MRVRPVGTAAWPNNAVMTQAPDTAWYDAQYNNRARVPDHPAVLARWAAESARVRAARPQHLDLPYGTGPNETLDVYPAAAPGALDLSAPLNVSLLGAVGHGGHLLAEFVGL